MSIDELGRPAPGGAGGRRWEPSFRAKLVAGVCGLVLLTGAGVLWLAHHSARAGTEALTGSVFREVSGRAVTHTRGFVLRAAPVLESLVQLADKGLVLENP